MGGEAVGGSLGVSEVSEEWRDGGERDGKWRAGGFDDVCMCVYVHVYMYVLWDMGEGCCGAREFVDLGRSVQARGCGRVPCTRIRD